MIGKRTNSTFLIIKNYYNVWVGYNKNVQHNSYFKNSLDYIFKPRSIGIIGATERKGSVGNSIVDNLIKGESNYKLYFINSKGSKIYNRQSYKSLKDIKEDSVDLAVIAVPRNHVVNVMHELKIKNVRGVVIITAGFKETGAEGLHLENEIINIGKTNNMRIIGPNCLGIIHSYHNMNASFASNDILKGHFSLLSQSGAICSAALDLSLQHNIGFSHFISVGSMCDVQFYELVEYLFYDVNTKYILLYVESIGDMNRFVAVCKKVCLYKPIILLKSGKTAKAAEAAISHTGSMVGNYEIFYATMKKLGVLVVDNFEELFNMCKVLNSSKYPETNEVCVVTNAGGPGVLLVDNIIKNDGVLSNLNDNLKNDLNSFLPDSWSKANPIDILGDASPVLYKKTINAIIKDKQYKNIIVLLSPQSVTEPLDTANEIINLKKEANEEGRLILCNYLGGTALEESANVLNKNYIPTFVHPEHSVQNLLKLYKNIMHIQGIYQEIPDCLSNTVENHYLNKLIEEYYYMKNKRDIQMSEKRKKSIDIIKKAIQNKNYILNEFDSKIILENYDIPIVQTRIFENVDDIKNNDNFTFPCAMKIYSDKITHKKDIGGVILNINNKEELIESYNIIYNNVKAHKLEKDFKGVTIQDMVNINDGIEVILGYYYDNNFGPVLLFGSGGSYVEIFKDSVLLIPPLNFSYTHHTIKNTKIYKALAGNYSRFRKCDMSKLITTIVKFSELILDLLPYINECDINPLYVSGDKIIALDARFTLRKNNISDKEENIYYDTFSKIYPIDFISFNDTKNDSNILAGSNNINVSNNIINDTILNCSLDKIDSITRCIHPYDFKLIHKFCIDNYKELHNNTFFYTDIDSIKSELFSYELCNCDYDLYNVILYFNKKQVNGLIKIEKRNENNHCYIYAKDNSTFYILIQKLNKLSKKQNNKNNYVYLKTNSPYIQDLQSMRYNLEHTYKDVACYKSNN
ncbi:succinyl-CoA ligase, putative [Plasmodium sp. gorilla clade G2]|uniref:succinyl-CoA ligase, putative n=1 Tax=Plasmodium sp. gorilla clade G2 TaxID=880535 RepID=UPI000D2220C3|nr:succinyl-CoA ligase, putative [Plasmodium sp. gorilla clade G2]SOV19252.1 succinyl-CoA ligase, putative [Plasmodium sp. gorilla clade G2]